MLGRVTSEQFRILSGDYNAEQKELNAAIPAHEARLEKLKASAANVEAFIERIEIGERNERYSRTAEQESEEPIEHP